MRVNCEDFGDEDVYWRFFDEDIEWFIFVMDWKWIVDVWRCLMDFNGGVYNNNVFNVCILI